MYIKDKRLYANAHKLLDFKEPKYAVNEDRELVQVHLYTKSIRLGIMDSQDNYIEVNESEVK